MRLSPNERSEFVTFDKIFVIYIQQTLQAMARKKKEIINIGTLSKKQSAKIDRSISRQQEIDADPTKGFKSMHSAHKSDKVYTRKVKHKSQEAP